MWKILIPSFLKLLEEDIALEDQQIDQGGPQDAPRDFGAT